ncbi:ATP-binding cassette domain-containing protein, partial [Bacteriovorax sp. DB6_IX]|uniref:ATP-binding cassette domain-containing protein n=3 Tax=Bacteriovorax sp. DB6_IX TaxID=1353530 RepID=UPI00038A0313
MANIMNETLVVENLKKFYQVKGKDQLVKALNNVSFTLAPRTTLGIVGESGCGKSTLAKTLMNLEKKTEGSISFSGKSFDDISDKERYQTMQMVFQDPLDSLNPRKK